MSEQTEKYEFASKPWLERLQAAMEEAGASPTAAETAFSLCEAYNGVPPHLSSDGTLGFHVRFDHGKVDFRPEPASDVDVRIDLDYTTVLPMARLIVAGDPAKQAAQNRLMGVALSAGKMKITGDGRLIPAFLAGVHDVVARVTA